MLLRLLAALTAALWIWVVPAAHTLTVDSDGPAGLSDNADFDDVILSVISPTVALPASVPTVVSSACHVVGTVLALQPATASQCAPRLEPSRAPPALSSR